MYQHIKVTPTSNQVGAFIETDLSHVHKEAIEEIKDALADYGVIFFRKQKLDSKSYINFAKHFGVLADYPMLKGLEGFPQITVVEKKPDEKIMFGEGWHTDSTYTKEPPRYTMLYSIKTPEKGKGNTLFASQYLSYKNLTEEYKNKIQNLKALFSADGPISKTRANRVAEKGTGIDPKSLNAIHGIVKKNERNGKKSLYLSPGHVIKICDVEDSESKKLLEFLFHHQTKDEFVYGFEWEPNCLALWNNHAVLHNPVNDFTGAHRVMHRITIQ
jgi:taurine dioxygenase